MEKTKAFKVFDGKKFTLYKSGTKKDVSDYVKKYGIPKNALHRTIKAEGEYRLYMFFKK
jgi:hypothetical protein